MGSSRRAVNSLCPFWREAAQVGLISGTAERGRKRRRKSRSGPRMQRIQSGNNVRRRNHGPGLLASTAVGLLIAVVVVLAGSDAARAVDLITPVDAISSGGGAAMVKDASGNAVIA